MAIPAIYKRKFKGKNGEDVLSKNYYFKGTANGRRADINTQCSTMRDAEKFVKEWVVAPDNAVVSVVGVVKVQKTLNTDTIVDIFKKEGWFISGTNPKFRKSTAENTTYGVSHTKQITSALRYMFWNIDDLDDFTTFVRRNKIVKDTSIDDYINFRTKPINQLIKNDAIKFFNFLHEYTAWEKKNKMKSKDKFFICQNVINIVALKTFFTYSVETGIITSNLFAMISIPRKKEAKGKNKFSISQLKIMFNDEVAKKANKEVYESVFYRAFKFQALTGMRSGEIKAMTWKQIQKDKHILVINAAFKESTNKKSDIGLPKGDKVRTIYLCDSAVGCLGERKDKDDFVFSLKGGMPLENNKYTTKYQALLESVEIECSSVGLPFQEGRRYTPHCHRGTLNSLLVSTGTLADSLVQEYLGWTKTALTQVQRVHYTKFTEEGMFKIARQIELFFSGKEMVWKKKVVEDTDSIEDAISKILANKNDDVKFLDANNKDRGFGTFNSVNDYLFEEGEDLI